MGGAYLGGTGGPEWLDESVHPLQDRRRTQGSQSCEHDEGQHLPRREIRFWNGPGEEQRLWTPHLEFKSKL